MKKQMLIVASVLSLTGFAQAVIFDVVTYNGSSSASPIDGSGSAQTTISLPQFDNTVAGPKGDQIGAVLLTVSMTVNGSMSGSATYNNTSGSTALGYEVVLKGNSSDQNILFGNGTQQAFLKLTYDHTYDLATGATPLSQDTGHVLGTPQDYTSAPDLTPFKGGSTVAAMKITWIGRWNADETSNVNFVPGVLSGAADWTVTYTYEVVPEPATMALFGIGGLVLALRRRFSKKA